MDGAECPLLAQSGHLNRFGRPRTSGLGSIRDRNRQGTADFESGDRRYYYQQVTADSGVGAKLGDFKGRVTALGGILTYDFALGKIPVSTQWSYFHEFDVENRLEGDAGVLTIVVPL